MLLVEDDELMARITGQLLARLGSVTRVAAAEDAVELLDARDWALVVTDVELPGMSGIDLLARVRETAPLASTLVLSGHRDFELAVRAIRAGADNYATKPYEPASLLGKAQDLLERAQTRRLAVGYGPSVCAVTAREPRG